MDMRVIIASAVTAAAVAVPVTLLVQLGRECPPAPVLVNAPPATVMPLPAPAVTVVTPPAADSESSAEAEDAEDSDETVTDDKHVALDEVSDDDVTMDDRCDAEELKEKGMANINMGQHAAALAQFEASLRCKSDGYVRQLAFMEACASGNSTKAKFYYKKLTIGQQTKFAQICIRQKPPVAYE